MSFTTFMLWKMGALALLAFVLGFLGLLPDERPPDDDVKRIK